MEVPKFFKTEKSVAPNAKNIYLDLDVLFDTRLATLYYIDPDTADYVVRTGQYHKRFRDNFGCISADIFYSFYRTRNKGILQYGIPTHMWDVTKEHYGELLTDVRAIEKNEDLVIYVNTYPYDLLDDEVVVIADMLKAEIPDVRLKLIHKSTKELTPDWITTYIGTIFMYNANNWLEYHSANANIYNNPLVNVYVLAPRLVIGPSKYYDKHVKFDKEYFLKIEKQMNIITNYYYIDPIMYSAKRVPVRVNKNDITDNEQDGK